MVCAVLWHLATSHDSVPNALWKVPVPKKSTSWMTQVCADMLLVTTQVWSSTILVTLEGRKRREERK